VMQPVTVQQQHHPQPHHRRHGCEISNLLHQLLCTAGG
jgi:hypothetical protein